LAIKEKFDTVLTQLVC